MSGFLIAALSELAQTTAPVITLQRCIDDALANGPDNRILQAGLEVSRSQFDATVMQNAFSLRATLGYNHGARNQLPCLLPASILDRLQGG